MKSQGVLLVLALSFYAAGAADDAKRFYDQGLRLLIGSPAKPADSLAAYELLERAAKAGHPEARLRIGIRHERGIATPVDTSAAVNYVRPLAAAKNVAAMYTLSEILRSPLLGSTNDVVGGAAWLNRALDAGFPAAQRVGIGTTPQEWEDSARHDGDRNAALRLAMHHRRNPGTNAFYWFLISQQLGHPFAERMAASEANKLGEEVANSVRLAAQAFRVQPRSGAQLSAEVQSALWHVRTDDGRFSKLLQRARSGDTQAQYEVALCYHLQPYPVPQPLQVRREGNMVVGLSAATATQPDYRGLTPQERVQRMRDYFEQRRAAMSGALPPAHYPFLKSAREWYLSAAKQGHRSAGIHYAWLALTAQGGPLDSLKGLQYLQPALDTHDRDSLLLAGKIRLADPSGKATDPDRAIQLLRAAAEAGSIAAAKLLGTELQSGKRLPPNLPEASRWLRSAAAGDSEAAQMVAQLVGQTTGKQPPPRTAAAARGQIRLAIVPMGELPVGFADLLTVHLSSSPNLAILERAELDRVIEEQNLNVTLGSEALKLGQILQAHGLLLLSTDAEQRLVARLVAVGPGVVIGNLETKVESDLLPQLASQAGRRFAAALPKLAVSANEAIPVSLLNLSTPIATLEARAVERELAILLTQALLNRREIFVLERRHLDDLAREKNFLGERAESFWNGSHVLDGEFNADASSLETVRLTLRATARDGVRAKVFKAESSREKLPAMVNELVGEFISHLTKQPEVRSWDPVTEALRFQQEAQFADRIGATTMARQASEAAWALGLRTSDLASLRLKHLVQAPSSSDEIGRAIEFFQSQFNAPLTASSADWHGHGISALEKAGETLRRRFLAARDEGDGTPSASAALRAACRDVESQLLNLEHLSQRERDRFHDLRFQLGRFWQESPAANAEWLARLFQSAAADSRRLRLHLDDEPLLTFWDEAQRQQFEPAWAALQERLLQSSNSIVRIELLFHRLGRLKPSFTEAGYRQAARDYARAARRPNAQLATAKLNRYAGEAAKPANELREQLIASIWNERLSVLAEPGGYWQQITNRLADAFTDRELSVNKRGNAVTTRLTRLLHPDVMSLIERVNADRQNLERAIRLADAIRYLQTAAKFDASELSREFPWRSFSKADAQKVWPAFKQYGQRFDWPRFLDLALRTFSRHGVTEASKVRSRRPGRPNFPAAAISTSRTVIPGSPATPPAAQPDSSAPKATRPFIAVRDFQSFPMDALKLDAVRPPEIRGQQWFYEHDSVWIAASVHYSRRDLSVPEDPGVVYSQPADTNVIVRLSMPDSKPRVYSLPPAPERMANAHGSRKVYGRPPITSLASTDKWLYCPAPDGGLQRCPIDQPRAAWKPVSHPALGGPVRPGFQYGPLPVRSLWSFDDRIVISGSNALMEMADDRPDVRFIASNRRRLSSNPLDLLPQISVVAVTRTKTNGYLIGLADGRVFQCDAKHSNWREHQIPGQQRPRHQGILLVSGKRMNWFSHTSMAAWNPDSQQFELLYRQSTGGPVPRRRADFLQPRWNLPPGADPSMTGMGPFTGPPVVTSNGDMYALRSINPRLWPRDPADRPRYCLELWQFKKGAADGSRRRVALYRSTPDSDPNSPALGLPKLHWTPGGLAFENNQGFGFWRLSNADLDRLFASTENQ